MIFKRRPFQFQLSTLLYVVTAVAVLLAVELKTMNDAKNRPAVGMVVYCSIAGWFLFRWWRDGPRPSAE